jgi:hypothetical protein
VRAVLEHGLAGLIGIREGRGIDMDHMDHHLVSLPGPPGSSRDGGPRNWFLNGPR